VVTHFIVAADVARSRDFYTGVLGGTVVLDGEPTIVKLANSWVIINLGGGPTDDKPQVVLESPTNPTRASAFSTSGWPISRPSTRSGAREGPSS
jgi:catechol 2,3-dioxygenase-like lactoylglutathione lyase family enzyme